MRKKLLLIFLVLCFDYILRQLHVYTYFFEKAESLLLHLYIQCYLICVSNIKLTVYHCIFFLNIIMV